MLDDAVLELFGISDSEERSQRRTELYTEITPLYCSIRTAEKRMNKFKSQSKRKGSVTPQSIAIEIWERNDGLRLKPLAEYAAGFDCEAITLPPGKARAVNNLLNAHSLFIAGEHIALEYPERVEFAKTLTDLLIVGPVVVPNSPEVCKTALQDYCEEQQKLDEQFHDLAADYTADEALQKRIVAELWRKSRQPTS